MARTARKQLRRIRTTGTVGAAVMALLVLFALPAAAHHKADHEQGHGWEKGATASDRDGDADSDSSSTQTENDADPRESTREDVSDEGDNKHPSRKDRSVEHGNSTSNPNQGKAESNPDDSKGPMRYEGGLGDDKPNGPGGTDAADQDGNNGCGNDDDFDDDNNGHCGKPEPTVTTSPSPAATTLVCPAGTDLAGEEMDDLKDCDEPGVRVDRVLPKLIKAPAVEPKVMARPNTSVLGAVLPFTGASLLAMVGLALASIGLGIVALKVRTNR